MFQPMDVNLQTAPLMANIAGPQADNLPQFKKPGGMFGGGGKFGPKEALAFGLAGFASRQNPMLLQGLLAAMMQKQKQAQEDQQYQRERGDKRSDFVFEQQYKTEHPGPVNNDTANDYSFWQSHLSPEQFQEYVQNKVNPPQFMNVPGVGLVQVPRQAAPAAPTAPVGKLTPLGAGGPGASPGGFPY